MEQGSKSLNISEAQALLVHTPESVIKKTPRHWISGIDAKQLLAAIDSKSKKVYLNTMGRTFTIVYPKVKKDKDKVWVQVENGFVPCAWVVITSLRREVEAENVLSTL